MAKSKVEFNHFLYLYVITWLFIILGYIVYKVLNGTPIKEIEVIVIALFGMVNLMLGYQWGASSSGARKDAAIQSLAGSQVSSPTEIKVANVEQVNTTTDTTDNNINTNN